MQAAFILNHSRANIMVATGSKQLHLYTTKGGAVDIFWPIYILLGKLRYIPTGTWCIWKIAHTHGTAKFFGVRVQNPCTHIKKGLRPRASTAANSAAVQACKTTLCKTNHHDWQVSFANPESNISLTFFIFLSSSFFSSLKHEGCFYLWVPPSIKAKRYIWLLL